MGILVFLFLKLFFFWAILTVFEVAVIRRMKVSTFKYIKLLKILEILFFLMIFFGEILFIAFTFLYFLVLFSDFKKKIISKEELIINTLFYFIDILLIILAMLLILRNLPSI